MHSGTLFILVSLVATCSTSIAADEPFRVSARNAADVPKTCKLASGAIARQFARPKQGLRKIEFTERVTELGPPVGYELTFPHGERGFAQSVKYVSPCYTVVELSKDGRTAIVYAVDSATLPSQTLRNAISPAVDRNSLTQRLEVVSFFVQMNRVDDARNELNAVAADFPSQDLTKQFSELDRLRKRAE